MNQLKVIRTITKANLQVSMTYKINFLLGIFSTFILIFIHYHLWLKIYEGNQVVQIGGYTFTEMIVYIIMIRVLYVFANSLNIEEKVSKEIKDGDISLFITKPINYLVYNISTKLGDMIIQIIISILVLMTFFIIMIKNMSFVPSVSISVLVFITAIFGLLLNTLIGYVFALMAFWIEQVSIMFVFKKNLLNFISGVWIPISLFPSSMKVVLEYLPFNYLQYFSVTIFQQSISEMQIVKGLVVQVVWLFILLLLSQIIWKRGVAKFTSVGG